MNFEELKEQWEELETWKKLLITLFFSGIIIYIGYMFLLEPKINQKKSLENEVSKLQKDVNYLKKYATQEKLNMLNNQIKSIREKISQKEQELESYKKYIPNKPFTEQVLVRVSKISERSNLDLETFSVRERKTIYAVYKKDLNRVIFKDKLNKGETGVKLSRVSFEVKSKGSMKNLYKFIKFLTDTKRIIIVDRVDISKGKGNLSFNIKFSSYYMED